MDEEKQTTQLFGNLFFPKVFQSFRMAIQPTKLMIVLIALLIICLLGWLMDYSRSVIVADNGANELKTFIESPEQLQFFYERYGDTTHKTGVFSTLWQFTSTRFHHALYLLFQFNLPEVAENIGACFMALVWAFRYHYIYSIIFFLISLAVLSITGGAVCRIAALQLARGEKPGSTEALRYGLRKFLSFFTAPLLPIGIMIFVGVFVYLLGLIGNIPLVGEVIMGVFIPLAILAGAIIAVVLIGAVVGFNVMFPAVAYDGSDCFDALSRAFSYIYSRPWRMAFYSGLALVYGAICYVFVRFFTFLLLIVAYAALSLGIFSGDKGADKLARVWTRPTFLDFMPPDTASTAGGTEAFAAFLIYLLMLFVLGLVISYVLSFYFSANTIIYSLLRNKVDNTSFDDIYTLAEKTEQQPEQAPPEDRQEAQEPEQVPEESKEDSEESEKDSEKQSD